MDFCTPSSPPGSGVNYEGNSPNSQDVVLHLVLQRCATGSVVPQCLGASAAAFRNRFHCVETVIPVLLNRVSRVLLDLSEQASLICRIILEVLQYLNV